jgi:hypothetical protein
MANANVFDASAPSKLFAWFLLGKSDRTFLYLYHVASILKSGFSLLIQYRSFVHRPVFGCLPSPSPSPSPRTHISNTAQESTMSSRKEKRAEERAEERAAKKEEDRRENVPHPPPPASSSNTASADSSQA